MTNPVLVAVSQIGSLKEVPITSDKFFIGRGLHNGLVVEDVNVSRTHCMFEHHNNQWSISDKSSNGTWLNGQLLDKSKNHPLSTGDIIGLSESLKFVFKIPPNKTTRAVGSGTKKTLSEDDILNIAGSVIADVEAFQADCESDKFQETVFNISTNNKKANNYNQPGASSSTVDAEVNNISVVQPKISKLVQQPIVGYVIQKQDVKVEQNSAEQQFVEANIPVTASCSAAPVVPQLDAQEPKDSTNSSAQPQLSNFENVEDELQCSICTEMFVQAVTLSCSHTYCKYCITQWQKNQSFCPICRQKITLQFPTRVVDNFIEKIIENASDDVKQHRRELIEQRQIKAASEPAVATTSSSTSTGTRRTAPDPIEISSGDDNDDDDDDDFDDYMSDYSGSDSDDREYDYNGLPGQYYGGYGHCFSCGQRGHWANGCPSKRH